MWDKLPIPLDSIEERERLRNTSPIGHARSHYDSVHTGMHYDYTITDPTLSAEEIATQIMTYIDSHPHPTAIHQLAISPPQ